TGGTADRNRSHWSTSKTPSYTKSVSWQHHPYIRLRHFEFTNGRIISDFNGMGKVKYHFLTIKSVLFLVYQTISIHSKSLEIIKTQVFHWLIYSYIK
ncbi:hypothetical protein LHL08_14745, partial [Escherichia coli]|uniref:hypothetical protein n=1 Tax=Escherichia coli TaxID=562 RepID=UPI001CFA4510